MKDDNHFARGSMAKRLEGQNADNRSTRMDSSYPALPAGAWLTRALFHRHYASFAPTLRAFGELGVGIVAIDRRHDRIVGISTLAAGIGEARRLILGRHSCADLVFADDALSLRHLAVIVESVSDFLRPGRGVAYRVIDLRSGHGLFTEEGHEVGGVRADGPAFFAAGHLVVYVFVTGDATDWPDSAEQAWSFIPERTFLGEQPRLARGSVASALPSLAHRSIEAAIPVLGDFDPRATQVIATRMPSSLIGHALIASGEEPLGELTIHGDGKPVRLLIGPQAMDDGILIGRYERCDGASVLQSNNLSRVHLLLTSVGDDPHAIDTASQNGSYVDGADESLRIVRLSKHTQIRLGDAATVTWRGAP